MLLLHGWTASADTTWFSVYPALAGQHRLIAVDQRGHGRGIRSEEPFSLEACADDAAGLLELLGIPKAIVVGYSMGGAVGLLLWRRHPELVAGLVMCGTALEWRSTPRERHPLEVARASSRWPCDSGPATASSSGTCTTPWPTPPRWPSCGPGWGGSSSAATTGTSPPPGSCLSRFDARPFIDGVDVPCASVVTERDRLVRAKEQLDLAEALGAPVFAVDGDHDTPLVRPKEFSTAVSDAIDSVADRCAGNK